MISFESFEIWLVTGSQHLYGPEALDQVEQNSSLLAQNLAANARIPIRIISKPVLTTPDEIVHLCREANSHPTCIGLIAWMHTFSPAKMWIGGLKMLDKPLLHLHTQMGQKIPWASIDMDFMNLHQSAHGGREFGFINTRMGKSRTVVVGHWKEERVAERIGNWARICGAWADSQHMKIARIGDNMREVAVTEGNKVSAQIQFGYSVNGYGLGEVVSFVKQVETPEIDRLVEEYQDSYQLTPELVPGASKHPALREAAQIELGLQAFLESGAFTGFTDTFENLNGFKQLPGIAAQRLMAKGFGFGAEGDWKTAALLRTMKFMSKGMEGGTSFMEDYTYHFGPEGMKVLGAHMLEICPSIADGIPSCEIHPLGIGGKEDPVRLVFESAPGPAINVSLIDLGHRFRLLVNEVEAIPTPEPLPKLPVARVLWEAYPDSATAAEAWILAGGAHHTCFSQSLTYEFLEMFAEIAGIECIRIGKDSTIQQVKQALRWNELCY
ncbi:MAG: L-arabinose isomerase [Bacteroidota bacterium]